jgi:thiazole synthase
MKIASDILIIGGGIVGLSIALDLRLRGASVTLLSRDFQQAASHAAAGMLAPHAEALPPGPMLDLARRSLWLYPQWTGKLEDLTGINTGYLPCGILAPVYQPPQAQEYNSGLWLDKNVIQIYQPNLGADVVGGWWYPEDAQVDNRKLVQALRLAVQDSGVELREGIDVEAICQRQGKVTGVITSLGQLRAQKYVLAGGAWSNQLLPLPVRPLKGQMLSLRMPRKGSNPLPIQRVIFGPQTYLVPRQDGRLIVGATAEDIGWVQHNTSKGIQTLLTRAIRLYPALEDWQLEEIWWGFRPATADELPILGRSSCDNLFLATGHYRNGILLAPITASLLADLILSDRADPILSYFTSDRFYNQPMNSLTSSHKNPVTHYSLAAADSSATEQSDDLIIAGRRFRSRLMTGTGKYPNIEAMQQSVVQSECEIVTVAVRRVQTKAPGHEGLAEALDWTKIWMLPNTAGCQTAEEAIRVARLGREMARLLGQEDNNFVKLEVIPDAKYLLPDPFDTLQAAEQLVKEGFAVLPYINADPLLAKRLEEIGCATVMPLGSPIGSGQGIKNEANIRIIIEESKIPVVIDAGIGTPSEAAHGMEMGADALLVNSAIALAHNPVAMAKAMGLAAKAGRLAYLAGRMPLKTYASASSPLTGTVR